MSANFLIVPVTLGYLDQTNYGIWLALTSALGWINYFDLGLGNGLRNRLGEALAKDDTQLARVYISTAYATLSAAVFLLYVLFMVSNSFVNWDAILNTPVTRGDELTRLTSIVFTLLCIRMITGLIGIVLTADQRPAFAVGMESVSNVISLAGVVVLRNTTEGSLLYLGSYVTFVSAFVPLVAGVYFFGTRYKSYRPSLSCIRLRYASNLMSLGARFFVLQIVYIIVFASANIVITQLFGPAEVTAYNIAFKYFYVVVMLFSLVTSPLWSAFTDAFTQGDDVWIRDTVRRTVRAWFFLGTLTVVMLAVSPFVYKLWVGETVQIPFSLSVAMCLLVLAMTWNGVFTLFVNGVGKIQLQLFLAVLAGVCFVPISILLAKVLGLGSTGVVLGTVACLLPGAIVTPIQYERIIDKRAKGVWNK